MVHDDDDDDDIMSIRIGSIIHNGLSMWYHRLTINIGNENRSNYVECNFISIYTLFAIGVICKESKKLRLTVDESIYAEGSTHSFHFYLWHLTICRFKTFQRNTWFRGALVSVMSKVQSSEGSVRWFIFLISCHSLNK